MAQDEVGLPELSGEGRGVASQGKPLLEKQSKEEGDLKLLAAEI